MSFHVIVGASAAGRVRRHRRSHPRILRSGAHAADAAAQHSGDRSRLAGTGAPRRPDGTGGHARRRSSPAPGPARPAPRPRDAARVAAPPACSSQSRSRRDLPLRPAVGQVSGGGYPGTGRWRPGSAARVGGAARPRGATRSVTPGCLNHIGLARDHRSHGNGPLGACR